jgi:hypothetical protein
MNLRYTRIDNVEALRSLGPGWIGQELLSGEFGNGELFECWRVNRWMYLVGNDDNTFFWREAAGLYGSGKTCNAIADNNYFRPIQNRTPCGLKWHHFFMRLVHHKLHPDNI